MEAKFRPVPLTILDFMAALLPGFVWLLLTVATFHVFLDERQPPAAPPLAAWQDITSSATKNDALLVAFLLTVVSLLIGYILKPLAMGVAGKLAKHLPKIDPEARRVRPFDFPFNEYFKTKYRSEQPPDTGGGRGKGPKDFYQAVVDLLADKLPCSPEGMPGHEPFGAAKRYLRLAAPTLWEESERMEAEVRMVGVTFLAALYSLGLSSVVLILQLLGVTRRADWPQTVGWVVASLFAAVLLAAGFNRARIREVGYTYVNALIAMCCSQPPSPPAHHSAARPDGGDE